MKGREITLPSPYEEYTKLKTEFVTTNDKATLTFRNRVLYIGRAHRYPPNIPFYIFFTKYMY
jgi:hypothetical protein